jgi:Ni/Fe-hydrogenase 1 B-type cytochrome subunit
MSSTYSRIYVWEWPVRFFHWLNVACIIVLASTGYLVAEPIKLSIANEAYNQYSFGIIRFIHFATAYVFAFNLLFRLYWGFVGNKYSKWSNFVPHKSSQFKEAGQVLKMDVLLASPKTKLIIGHNSLASFVYFIIFIASIFQILTGFTLYSDNSSLIYQRILVGVISLGIAGVLWRYFNEKTHLQNILALFIAILIAAALYFIISFIFGWLVVDGGAKVILGADSMLKRLHSYTMWVFLLFFITHVYLVFYHDYVEGRGVASSMIGGWKFIKKSETDN